MIRLSEEKGSFQSVKSYKLEPRFQSEAKATSMIEFNGHWIPPLSALGFYRSCKKKWFSKLCSFFQNMPIFVKIIPFESERNKF